MSDLEQMLNDPAETEQEQEQEAQQDEAKAEAESTGEQDDGATPAPEQEQAQTPSLEALQAQLDDMRKEASGLKYALTDERQKRQIMEQRLGQQPQEQKHIDPLEDPDGYRQEILGQVQSAVLNERINMSRSFAQARYEDYPQMEQRFADLANQHPQLIAELRQQQNPAEYAYQTAKKSLASNSADDVYAAKLAEAEKRLEEKYKDMLARVLPPGTSELRATSAPDENSAEPESLDDILKR